MPSAATSPGEGNGNPPQYSSLEMIILSETNQKEKDKYYLMPLTYGI